MVRDRTASRFDLARRKPYRLQRLQAEVAEVDDTASLSDAAHAAAMLFAVLDPPWLKHTLRLWLCNPNLSARLDHVTLIDPDFDTNPAHRGVCFGKSIIDIRPQSMERYAPGSLGLGTRNLCAAQTPADPYFDA
jgi:hypothetical protein